MGWTFTRSATKKDIIDNLTKGEENNLAKWTSIACCIRGNVLWVVQEVLKKSTGVSERYIICNLLSYEEDYGWGYKDISESMGPFYYSCPVSYLKLAPRVDNAKWREEVLDYHALK